MLRRKVRLGTALPIALAVAAIAFIVDERLARGATETKPTVWSNKDCLKCHLDVYTLRKMQDKRGDPTYCQAAFDELTGKKPAASKKEYAPNGAEKKAW